ncbi:LysR family transcriptional regulator [Streptomyces sp. NBC_00063]
MAASWDLRQLECFLAVAEERHFRKAAERLHLSPASVSEAVAGLERRLGGRLFDRSTRRVRLTAHGERFLDDVREPYQRLRRAHEAARARSRDREGISIAYTPELGTLFLPALLAAAPRSVPSTALAWRPLLMHTAEQIREIDDGSVDVGLCWSAVVRRPLKATVLCEIPVVAILREDDPLAARAEIPLAQLRDRRVLVTPGYDDNPFLESRRRADFAQAGIATPNVDAVQRYDELAVHVASGERIGLHPATIAVTNSIPGIVFRPVVEPTWHETICVLTHSVSPHPDVDAVVTALTDAVEELRDSRLSSVATAGKVVQ